MTQIPQAGTPTLRKMPKPNAAKQKTTYAQMEALWAKNNPASYAAQLGVPMPPKATFSRLA